MEHITQTPAGAVSEFWSGGCELASEASRKFLAPPCEFLAPPPLQGGANFYRGGPTINPLTYKYRADI